MYGVSSPVTAVVLLVQFKGSFEISAIFPKL